MRSFGLSLILVFLSYAAAAPPKPSFACTDPASTTEECRRLVKPVTTVTPGSYYIAEVPCLGCPIVRPAEDDEYAPGVPTDLFFAVTLSQDNRTILLNDQSVFPSLSTNPKPPTIHGAQLLPGLDRPSVEELASCSLRAGHPIRTCPYISQTDWLRLDYDYYSHWLRSDPETQTEQWEITFDAIGGRRLDSERASFQFNNSQQVMLLLVVRGKEVKGERYAGEKDLQAASSLFGAIEESEKTYEYEIVSLNMTQRSYTFPPQQGPGLRSGFRRFFGLDIVSKNGHIIYLHGEWGNYGKKGSLRNHLGIVIHDWPWDLVFIILGSSAGVLLAIWGASKLFLLVKRQRELARWDGIDAVWENMRRGTPDEEEDRLLNGSYRDEPDEGSMALYTDDVDTNKPLPSKPLPEKPLPAVPLIDA